MSYPRYEVVPNSVHENTWSLVWFNKDGEPEDYSFSTYWIEEEAHAKCEKLNAAYQLGENISKAIEERY